MKSNLVAALCEATRLTRTQKLADAIRLIQETLSGSAILASHQRQAPTAAPSRLSEITTKKPDRAYRAQAASGQPSVKKPQAEQLRRPLGQTINLLRQGKMGRLNPMTMERPTWQKRPVIPEGAEFLTRSFNGPSGTRDYELYVPRHSGTPAGLVVMLHGCTQGPVDFAIGTGMNQVAEERGLIVAYPAQSQSANPSLCWNWFNPNHQKRGSGEPATIAGLTQELIAEFGLNRKRVFIAGLSAGGAMAAIMGGIYPDVYAAVGVHSGLGSGAAGDLISALAAMRGEEQWRGRHRETIRRSMRTIVFHGDADPTVHPSNGDRIVAAAKADLESGRDEVLSGRSPGGIDYLRATTKNAAGHSVVEHWIVHGLGHAWSGGSSEGSYTEPRGPDASREMIRFFFEQARLSESGDD
ncbi:MAG: PHB depolymerase family esterase [Verrucomicrobia bacterium]|nr:PHB depolymerase family esterase [Verrucomicrobiota bacterium]